MTGDDSDFEGERISKVMARAGVCSRRDAERWITAGRVAINGRTLDTPAVNVAEGDVVTIDGEPLATPQEARLWRYHKPPGLVTTHKDPQGRPTVFDRLPRDLPRVVSIGRLDLNSEGLLLLTNDGALAGKLEHPTTAWTRRYRARVNGIVDAARLASVAEGVTVDGVTYGPVTIEVERQQGSNAWLAVSLTEGKNREIRRIMEHLGYRVNRLIRVAYGPFSLGRLDRGQVEEVPRKVLRDALATFGEAVPETLRKPKPESTAKWAKAKPRPTKPGQSKRREGPVAAAKDRPDRPYGEVKDRPGQDRPNRATDPNRPNRVAEADRPGRRSEPRDDRKAAGAPPGKRPEKRPDARSGRPDGEPLPPARPGAAKKRARRDGLPGPRPVKAPPVKRKT
jgi:23S rRNA pseudouridine2605 synthase